MSLRIGTAEGKPFTLPLDVAQWAMAIHGVRGKGKTVTAAVIVEEVLGAGVQTVIVDPTDVWWGLKSSRDGQTPGHPVVILGGAHGDLPLQHEGGRAVADFIVDHGPSVILSLRHLRKGQQSRFMTDFCEQLYHRKGESENRQPLLLVIDEASRFVPQRVQGDQARMVGAIEDIVRLGRASGFGVILVDQRPASVNKDVLTQIELLVCHAVTSPQDRKALTEWIRGKDTGGHEREFLDHLASLDRGEAWFWLPMSDVFARVRVRMRDTFDSSATPEIGEAPPAPSRLAEVDLDALAAALQGSIEEALANDPKALKKRIATLEAELRTARADSGPDIEDVIEERDRAVLAALEAQRTAFRRAVEPAKTILDDLAQILEDFSDSVGGAVDELVDAAEDGDGDVRLLDVVYTAAEALPTPRPAAKRAAPQRPQPRPGLDLREEVPDLAPRHRKILDALARLEEMGLPSPSRSVLAAVAEYSPKSSGYDKALSRLSSLELVHYPGPGLVGLTVDGQREASPPTSSVTLDELHGAWFRILDPRHVRILQPLISCYPAALSRPELAARSEYSPSSSGYDKAVSRLSSFGLVTYPQPGHVVATELLFPEGLR